MEGEAGAAYLPRELEGISFPWFAMWDPRVTKLDRLLQLAVLMARWCAFGVEGLVQVAQVIEYSELRGTWRDLRV